MDKDIIERERPATMVECPWCGGAVELRDHESAIACGDCLLVVAIAPDEPSPAEVAPLLVSAAA